MPSVHLPPRAAIVMKVRSSRCKWKTVNQHVCSKTSFLRGEPFGDVQQRPAPVLQSNSSTGRSPHAIHRLTFAPEHPLRNRGKGKRNSQAPSHDIRTDHEKLVRIHTLPGPHKILPPTLLLTRLPRDTIPPTRDMRGSGQPRV